MVSQIIPLMNNTNRNSSVDIIENGKDPALAIYRDNPVYQFVVYPNDQSISDLRSRLVRLTVECLVKQLRSRSTRTKPQSLIGQCNKNAVELGKYLKKNNIGCDIYLGYNKNAGVAENIEEAYDKQIIHWWVECKEHTLEICSECRGYRGRMYISNDRPGNYCELGVASIENFEAKGYPYPRIENLGSLLK